MISSKAADKSLRSLRLEIISLLATIWLFRCAAVILQETHMQSIAYAHHSYLRDEHTLHFLYQTLRDEPVD